MKSPSQNSDVPIREYSNECSKPSRVQCDHDESMDRLRTESGSLLIQSEVVEDNNLPVHNQDQGRSKIPDTRPMTSTCTIE